MSLRTFKVSVRAVVVLTVALGFVGCGKRQPATGGSESRAKSTDFVQMDSETTEIEQHCLEFGRSVMLALAARNYVFRYVRNRLRAGSYRGIIPPTLARCRTFASTLFRPMGFGVASGETYPIHLRAL